MDYNLANKTSIATQLDIVSVYYKIVAPLYTRLGQDAINASVFGGDSNIAYNKINDLHYLLALLIIINEEMIQDLNNGLDRPWYDKTYYIEKYDLECIRKAFWCHKIEIAPMLAIIGLNTQEAPSGIGYMYIQGNPSDTKATVFHVS